jgi:hypothetical protein
MVSLKFSDGGYGYGFICWLVVVFWFLGVYLFGVLIFLEWFGWL